MSKKQPKPVPIMTKYTIPTSLWDKPINLTVELGSPQDGYMGCFDGENGNMIVNGKDFSATLMHEVMEYCVLQAGCHFRNSIDNDILMAFSHVRFNDICEKVCFGFMNLYSLICDLFIVDNTCLSDINDYGKKLVKSEQIKKEEIYGNS